MSAVGSKHVQEIFAESLARDPADRARHLDERCGPDLDLRSELEGLLRAHEQADAILACFESRTPGLERCPEPAPSRVGTRLGPYQIVREAGRGGMGLVYEARDIRLDRGVALKFLGVSTDTDTDAEAKARLLVEARAAAALDHPHIATVYEVEEAGDGQLFIAMAYYDGQTLKEAIARGPLNEDEVVRIVAQVAEGLEAAHHKEIVHRDIKPANILVTNDGVAKILDFGIARIGDSDLTEPGSVMGTTAYMSPEQIRGGVVDQRSDLWSLGVVCYEALTGRKPFEGSSAAAMMYSILNETPAPLRPAGPGASGRLQSIIDRVLAKDVSQRYQRASELRADLEAARRAAAATAGAAADTLPVSPTSFVGRAREIDGVRRLLERTRLVTLTGPGGTGKTRLALEVARRCRGEFPEGVYFVPLASLHDASLIHSAVARAIGLRDAGEASLEASIREFLASRSILIVLDNFEHLLEAASFVSGLLASCPGVRIIVTSRAPLHLSGEHEDPVPPLALPAPGQALDADASLPEAVALFVARAQAIHAGFALSAENRVAVNEICIRLDGLPLAIELAAARIKVLPPKALLARLENRLELLTGGARDAPARHHTLRQAIGWSYDLLSKDEKTLLRRIAVFSGGLSLDAAEQVGRLGGASGIDVITCLSSLVDKSLVRQEEQPDGLPRFLMLETIREFAGECLVGSGEAAEAKRAHAACFLAFVEAAASELRGPEQAAWLARLERDHDNIRQVLTRSSAAGDSHTAGRLAASLLRFWLAHGHLAEGRRVLDQLLSQGADGLPSELQAVLLCGAGTLAHNQGDFKVARAFFERGLILYRQRGDELGVAETLNHLAWVAWREGDYTASAILAKEALALCRRAQHTRGVAIAVNNLGWTAHYQGDYRAARSCFAESLALQRQLEDERGVAFALNNLGRTLHELGDEEATSCLTEAVALFRKLGEKQLLAFTLSNLAHVALSKGEADRALALLSEESVPKMREIADRWGLAHALGILSGAHAETGDIEAARAACEESRAIRHEIGDRWGLAACEARLADLAQQEGDEDRAGSHYRRSLDLLGLLSDRAGIAVCLEGLAWLAARNDRERAARLLGAADVLRQESGASLRGRRADRHRELRALLIDALGPDRFERAMTVGRGLTIPGMVALASQAESPPDRKADEP